jgi:drug/metabolite transporter (DMT)-like permease
VIVFFFPVVAVPATLPFAIHVWVWPSARGWLLMLGLGVATQIAQVLFTRGLAVVPAGRGTTVGYVQIIFAAAWGYFFFGASPSMLTLAGAVLIVLATGILLWRRSAQPSPASRR